MSNRTLIVRGAFALPQPLAYPHGASYKQCINAERANALATPYGNLHVLTNLLMRLCHHVRYVSQRQPLDYPAIRVDRFNARVRRYALSAVTGMALAFAGCFGGGADRPDLGYVTGQVKMDGQPLGNVIVVMKPQDGRAAMTQADAEGRYDMEYIEGERGTKIGPTTVSFEWPLDYAAPKPIPDQYNAIKSQEKIEVKAGDNVFDFDLKSSPGAPASMAPHAD